MYIHKRLVAVRRSYEFAIGYVRGTTQRGGIDGSKNKQRRCFYYYNPMLLL
jgi:hypothetical protein